MTQKKKPSSDLPAEYRRLQRRLVQLDWVALGSLVERNQPGQGGPRYQWSRRVKGKTVTVALSAEQFAWMQKAIANMRTAWDILEEMHALSLQYLWENLPQTTRRKRLSKKTLGLK